MVNGHPPPWFGVSTRIRQGNHLSAILFTLLVDVLSMMVLRVCGRVWLRIFGLVRRANIAVSSLQFAEDNIFFLRGDLILLKNNDPPRLSMFPALR